MPLPGMPAAPPAHVTAELAGWQELAQMWPMSWCLSDPHARCEACGQSVIRLADDYGTGYRYAHADALSLVVAHIRQVHSRKR